MSAGNDDEQPRSLTSPEVVREITQGLEEINKSLNSIRDEFSGLRVDLAGIKDGKPLVEEWENISTGNTKLNSDFRACANDLQGFLRDFETVVLKKAGPVVDNPSDEAPRKSAAQEAGFVLEDSEALAKKVTALVGVFNTFKTRLVKFDETFDAYAAKKQTEKGKQIKEKTQEIKDLEAKREAIKQKIKDVVREHLKNITGPRFSWIWDLPVGRIIAIVLQFAIKSQVEREIQDLQKEYDDLTAQILQKKIELGKLQADSDALGDISAKLFLQASVHLDQVEGGVNLFQELYTLANGDCVSVSEYLTSPTSSKVPDILREYISQNRSVYKGLVDALSKFTIA